jgi:replicative DNA helicase
MTLENEQNEQEDYSGIEYQLFASCMSEENAVAYYAANLPDTLVGLPEANKGVHELYSAMLHFYRSTNLSIVDADSFRIWLKDETDIYDALGGDDGVEAMFSYIKSYTPPPKESIVEILKYKEAKSRQKAYLRELQILLSRKGLKSDKDLNRINELTKAIQDINNYSRSNPFDNVTTAEDIINRSESLLDIPDFVPTQFKSLNRAMGYTDNGGFFRGAVHAVIAPSGKGKSTFAKCLANNWLDNGYTVLYVNFEEAIGHWERILMTQILGENVYSEAHKWSQEVKKEKLEKFKSKLSQWGSRLMVRHDPDTPYFEDLENWLREIIGKDYKAPDVLIIDTIQSMFTRGKGKPRWGEFEEMMVKLEKLARDMNSVVIITAQENSNRMKEKREVVQQSDTGGSLAIQQKCAVTIFITEKRLLSDDETIDEYIMQLQIPKNRITGSSFTYDPPLVRYVDSKKIYEEYDVVDDESYSDSSSILDDLLSGKGFD